MRKTRFLVILLAVFIVMAGMPATAAPEVPQMDWDWLLEQVAGGAESVTLPNSIAFDGDAGLAPKDTVRIIGNGFALYNAVVDGGTVIFQDVQLTGRQGVRAESGDSALTIRGDETIVVLTGKTRADGGTSGPEGETGGDGVLMTGKKQGLIVNKTVTVTAGIGQIYGGHGIHVEGDDCNILLTDNASIVGAQGIGQGGNGLYVKACTKVTMESGAAVTGGASPYEGGHGIASLPCDNCDVHATAVITGGAMAIGGVGETGGNGAYVERTALDDSTDLTLSSPDCLLIGGAGGTAGAALRGVHAVIDYTGGGQIYGGQYFTTETPALVLEDCEILGKDEDITVVEGTQTTKYPASNVSQIVLTALSRVSDNYMPEVIENGMNVRAVDTKLNGHSVEKGQVGQAKVDGTGLKIYMRGGTLERTLHFQQRFMPDGLTDEGTRLVLIATVSEEWPTVESTVAALRKLQSIGITQLAYTNIDPVYNERIIDIGKLLEAVDAYETEFTKLLLGTGDDAVIFLPDKGGREYQEGLMEEIVVPLEEAPEGSGE